MCQNAHVKNTSVSGTLEFLRKGRQRVGVLFKNERVEKNTFPHTAKRRNRLRVGVCSKNAGVSGFACWHLSTAHVSMIVSGYL